MLHPWMTELILIFQEKCDEIPEKGVGWGKLPPPFHCRANQPLDLQILKWEDCLFSTSVFLCLFSPVIIISAVMRVVYAAIIMLYFEANFPMGKSFFCYFFPFFTYCAKRTKYKILSEEQKTGSKLIWGVFFF